MWSHHSTHLYTVWKPFFLNVEGTMTLILISQIGNDIELIFLVLFLWCDCLNLCPFFYCILFLTDLWELYIYISQYKSCTIRKIISSLWLVFALHNVFWWIYSLILIYKMTHFEHFEILYYSKLKRLFFIQFHKYF